MMQKDSPAAGKVMRFAQKEVQCIMVNLDLNVTQLGRLCGVNRTTAGKWVSGKVKMPITALRWLQSLETAYMSVQEAKGK